MTLIANTVTNVVIVIGLIGNLLSFLVFSRKAFAKSSINIYCRALAIFDSFGIFFLILSIGTYYVNTYSVHKYTSTCKLMYFWITTFSPISGWILVAFSIDQSICVSNTQWFQYTKKLSFQIGVVAFLAIFHIAAYIALPILLELKNVTIVIDGFNVTSQMCALSNIPDVKPYIIAYLIEANIVPFLIMILTTIYIVRELHKSSKRVLSVNVNVINSKNSKKRKYALNSVALSIIFIVCTSPSVFIQIFPSNDFVIDSFLYRIFGTFFYVNYSCHFFSHFIVNSVFRQEFLAMIRFGSGSTFVSTSQYTPKA